MQLRWGFDMRVEGRVRDDPRPVNFEGRLGYWWTIETGEDSEICHVFLRGSEQHILSLIKPDRVVAFKVMPRPYQHMALYEVLAMVPIKGVAYRFRLLGQLEPRGIPTISVNTPCTLNGNYYHNPQSIMMSIPDQNLAHLGAQMLRPGDWLSVTGIHAFVGRRLHVQVTTMKLAQYGHDLEPNIIDWRKSCRIQP